MDTTVIDGINYHVAPSNVTPDPIEAVTKGRGSQGTVHFLWPVSDHVKYLTISYDAIRPKQLLALLAGFGPTVGYSRTLSFYDYDNIISPRPRVYAVPGKSRLVARALDNGYWSLEVSMYARELWHGLALF